MRRSHPAAPADRDLLCPGRKANVLFFDRKAASETPWTKTLWIYDFRTNEHFTLKTNPLKRSDLDDFVARYNPENRHARKESERFKCFAYDDLLKRDKVSLDIFWLKDESLEDSANLPAPDVIAAEIAEESAGSTRSVCSNCRRPEEVRVWLRSSDLIDCAEVMGASKRGSQQAAVYSGMYSRAAVVPQPHCFVFASR